MELHLNVVQSSPSLVPEVRTALMGPQEGANSTSSRSLRAGIR
jgi:hypothetical protein